MNRFIIQKILWLSFIFIFLTPIFSEPSKEAEGLQNFGQNSWEGKKFAIGVSGLTGIGWVGEAFMNLNPLIQLNMRIQLPQNMHLSLHGSLNISLLPGDILTNPGVNLPVLLNIGYGRSIGPFYWYIEGGGGTEIQYRGPVFDASAGIEWLAFKYYSIALKFTSGLIYRNLNHGYFGIDTFGMLSLTANLVF